MTSKKTLIAHCKKMPHATQDIKWGADLVFSIGGKMFAVFSNEDDDAHFSCKADVAEFPRLTNLPGVTPAPYLARHHWIAISPDAKLPVALLKELLSESYQLVKEKLPRKVQEKLK